MATPTYSGSSPSYADMSNGVDMRNMYDMDSRLYDKQRAQAAVGGNLPSVYENMVNQQSRLFDNINNDFNSKGTLFSSAIYKPKTQVTQALAQQLSDDLWKRQQFAESQRQFDRSMFENRRQFDTSAATRLWELLTSGALQRSQIAGSTEGIWFPDQPGIFSDIWNARIAPGASSGGPVGDANAKDMGWVVPAHSESFGNLARDTENRIAADADADRALQSAYLKLAQENAAREAAASSTENDPWSQIMSAISANNFTDLDPATPGTQKAAQPSQLINTFIGQFGEDFNVITKARAGDARAVAALKLLYPETWSRIIEGYTPQSLQTEAEASANARHAAVNPNDIFTRVPVTTGAANYGYSYVNPTTRPMGQFPLVNPNPFVR